MLLSRPRRRRVMNLTPLIDVVFLLLVFFMLASTFLKYGTVKLETAGAGTAAGVDISKVVLIHLGAEGAFRIAGRSVASAEVANVLDELRAGGKTDAVIVLRKDAKAADLIHGLTKVRKRGFDSVRVVD